MSSIAICLIWRLVVVLVGAQSTETIVLRELQQGNYAGALRRVEQVLAEAKPEKETRERLEELRARCLYELEDYPACESALRGLLDRWRGSPASRRKVETQLALVLDLEGAHDEALTLAQAVLKTGAGPDARRLVVRILLERRRYAELGPHVEALLAGRPNDAFALFARGVAAAKSGDYRGAIPDLRQSAQDAGLRRNARFELALAYARLDQPREALVQLYAILSADPFDAEACHQVGRQLLRVEDRRQVRLAAQVLRYFESLKAALGASSLDHHLGAAGRAAEAYLERAARWERVQDLRRAVEAVGRASRLGPGDALVAVRVAEFWFRQGLLAEGEAALISRREVSSAPVIDKALERLAALRVTIREERDALGEARARLASSRWDESREPLQKLLRHAREQPDVDLADRIARLLLARDPDSFQALEHLVERTRSPELIIPHLHYLGRRARIDGAPPSWRAELARRERALLGEE